MTNILKHLKQQCATDASKANRVIMTHEGQQLAVLIT